MLECKTKRNGHKRHVTKETQLWAVVASIRNVHESSTYVQNMQHGHACVRNCALDNICNMFSSIQTRHLHTENIDCLILVRISFSAAQHPAHRNVQWLFVQLYFPKQQQANRFFQRHVQKEVSLIVSPHTWLPAALHRHCCCRCRSILFYSGFWLATVSLCSRWCCDQISSVCAGISILTRGLKNVFFNSFKWIRDNK